MKLLTIKINDILPRKEERCCNLGSHLNEILNKNIKILLAMDLGRYLIVDGHHRYFYRKKKGLKTIKAELIGYQEQTEFKNNFPIIKWGVGSIKSMREIENGR